MPKQSSRKFVCDIVPQRDFASLVFTKSLSRQGFWIGKLQELKASPGKLLKIKAEDQSSLTQIRNKARLVGMDLAYAREGEYVFIKFIELTEEVQRLMLLLREPRTISELQAARIEGLNLQQTLQDMASDGLVALTKSKWQLTDRGVDKLKIVKAASA